MEKVVITGSESGIGKATCEAVRAAGMIPIGTDLHESSKYGWEYHRCDLAKPDDVEKTFANIRDRHDPIRAFVHSAGHYHAKTFDSINIEDFDRSYAVNLRAPFIVSKLLAPGMIAAGRGQIINISSVSGHTGSLVTDYGATKAGLIGLTKGLAKTLGPSGIRVNAIAPGLVDTPMGKRVQPEMLKRSIEACPLRRASTPEEIAGLVMFVISDAGAYINGAVLDINGGSW